MPAEIKVNPPSSARPGDRITHMASWDLKSDDGASTLPKLGDSVDYTTFEQILEMDDDDERDFSRSIVFGFFEQAEETFVTMQKALDDKDLEELSQLGHFLKGSSATLGLVHVRDSCEKIQRYGKGQNEDGSDVNDNELCLKRIGETLKTLRMEYDSCEKALKKFYGSSVSEDGDKADTTGDADEADKTTEKTDEGDKAEKADEADKAAKTDKTDETDQADTAEKGVKADN
ncbi:hypothetical protein ACRALDRAFT_2038255 [Sodiomyces alcalophilus JCM 7366]|uniref:uncharacterized protein n=1 Tax=Sodiomyces alcalophilus JCM 7366 TaxID=591952 RepID=UPI0039B4FE76